MPRKTKQVKITSPEKTAQINKPNMQLLRDFLLYLRSVQRSAGTISGYESDLTIFFTYLLDNANNKDFQKVTKRDIIAFQNWLVTNGSSSARIRRIKAAISSLSNYCENILADDDPDFDGYRSIVRKIENPPLTPVREKTVWADEELEQLLDILTEKGEYEKACIVALGMYGGRRKAEFFLSEQQKVPERCWNQCYWYDYLRTYEEGISGEWMTFLDGGQKTHQRKHYEYFEEMYDASKYRGSFSTSNNINFRAYKPSTWAGVEPKSQITVTMYNKMYISMEAGTTAVEPIKAERGVAYTIDFPVDIDVGGTQVVINSASMIEAISGMEQLYPDTCVFSAATRSGLYV